MDRPDHRSDADPALTPPGTELSAEDELRLAFGRVLGFTVAAIILVLGGGVLVLVLGALFFGFLYGH